MPKTAPLRLTMPAPVWLTSIEKDRLTWLPTPSSISEAAAPLNTEAANTASCAPVVLLSVRPVSPMARTAPKLTPKTEPQPLLTMPLPSMLLMPLPSMLLMALPAAVATRTRHC